MKRPVIPKWWYDWVMAQVGLGWGMYVFLLQAYSILWLAGLTLLYLSDTWRDVLFSQTQIIFVALANMIWVLSIFMLIDVTDTLARKVTRLAWYCLGWVDDVD